MALNLVLLLFLSLPFYVAKEGIQHPTKQFFELN